MKCTHCNSENKPTARYCRHGGFMLVSDNSISNSEASKIIELQNAISDKENENEGLKRNYDKLRKDFSFNQKQLSEASKKINSLNVEVRGLNSKIKSQNDAIKKEKADADQYKNWWLKYYDENKSLKTRIKWLYWICGALALLTIFSIFNCNGNRYGGDIEIPEEDSTYYECVDTVAVDSVYYEYEDSVVCDSVW